MKWVIPAALMLIPSISFSSTMDELLTSSFATSSGASFSYAEFMQTPTEDLYSSFQIQLDGSQFKADLLKTERRSTHIDVYFQNANIDYKGVTLTIGAGIVEVPLALTGQDSADFSQLISNILSGTMAGLETNCSVKSNVASLAFERVSLKKDDQQTWISDGFIFQISQDESCKTIVDFEESNLSVLGSPAIPVMSLTIDDPSSNLLEDLKDRVSLFLGENASEIKNAYQEK